MTDFIEQRKAVIAYIETKMQEQGATKMQAINATTQINFWNTNAVKDLYAVIKSDLGADTIDQIVGHDFNGLCKMDPYFLPKSHGFALRKAAV